MIETWQLIWKIIFIAGVLAFAGMSVWVTIGGWQDIRQLFARLRDNDDEEE